MAINPENRMEQILAGEDITPANRTEYFVKEAIDNAGGGGSLPIVTSDDNGDVLTVVEGAWAKADAPSGLPAAGTDGNVLTADSGEWVSAAPVSDLPVVTSDDNGDVLTVVEGAWAKSAPSGDELIVTITPTSGTTGTTSIPIADIYNAYNAHKPVFVTFMTNFCLLCYVEFHGSIYTLNVISCDADPKTGTPIMVTMKSTGADTVDFEILRAVPSYDIADAGKVLKVNANGDGLEWVTP